MGALPPADSEAAVLPLPVEPRNRIRAQRSASALNPREVLQALPTAVYTTDAAGRITFYNEAAAALWGCHPELGKSEWCGSWRLYWPDGRPLPHDECPMAIALKEKRAIRGAEAVAERPDGRRIPFLAYPTPLWDETGALTGAINTLVDITERKEAERAARQLAAIVESSDDAIASKDLDGNILTWNRGAERLFGYTADEVIGKPITILIPPELHYEETLILEHIRRGERVDHYETVRRRKDGSKVEVSLTVSPIKDGHGRVIGASKIAHDTSERKEAQRSARQLAAIVESSDDAIVGTDLDGIVLTWNRGAERLFGYTADEVIGKPVTARVPPERHGEETLILGRIRRGERVEHYETVRRRKDGSLVEISLTVSPIKNAHGRVIGASKIARDISERKEAERAARQLAAIVESSDDAIASKDLDGIVLTWNRGAERLFGYTADEVIGKPITILIPPELHGEETFILGRIRRGEPVEHYETVRRRKDGSLVEISLTVSPIKDARGRVIGASKIARDITERKRAEEELRASEERFRRLFHLAPMAVFVCDGSGVIQAYNERAAQIWGRRPVCGDPNEIYCGSLRLRLPSGEVLPHDQSPIVQVLRTGEGCENIEVIIERPDGSQIPVLVSFAPLKSAAGEVTGAVTTFIDISDRKRAEEQQHLLLREMNHRVKNLFALAGALVTLSVRSAETPNDLAESVRERLAALARAQDLTLPDLTGKREGPGRATTLPALVRTIVAPYLAQDHASVSVNGPDVPISGKAVMGIALLLHEIATNAAKYGALSSRGGRVAVSWSVRQDELVLTWQERGGPPVDRQPETEGFGSLLARLTVTSQLGGEISHAWDREGLTVTVSAPVERLLK
jgi:PAS domain S-box-containing protein